MEENRYEPRGGDSDVGFKINSQIGFGVVSVGVSCGGWRFEGGERVMV